MARSTTGQVSDSAAEVYDELFVPALFAQFTEAVLDAARVQPADAVLDVGCGTGVLAAAAAARVRSDGGVTGIDVNPAMLAVAARERPGVAWRTGDAQELPFGDDSFDAVVSQFVLMFVPDPVRALEEMRRVARPGARVAVAVWASLDQAPGYAALARLLERSLGAQAAEAVTAPFSVGGPGQLRALFDRAGLEAHVAAVPGAARFPSLDDWLDIEIRGWALADEVDDDTLRRLKSDAREHLEPFAGPDGTVAVPVTALVAAASCG
jgi:ubiquinone/menaquinone biosynthesis C-methylase UbiE